MYPPTEILEEVGRVTIAGARLDLEMGMLWAIFDPEADAVKARKARKAPGAEQARSVRKLADQWLAGDLLTAVLEMTDRADKVRNQRNEIVHQDWILRGRDATRPVSDLPADFLAGGEEVRAYINEWRREAKESPEWRRIPRDSLELADAQGLDELRSIEQALADVTETVSGLRFTVASALHTGQPSEWLKDPDEFKDKVRVPPLSEMWHPVPIATETTMPPEES